MVTAVREPLPVGMLAPEFPLRVLHINGGVVVRPRPSEAMSVDAQPLTARERQVLALVAEGCSNKLVAAQLGISERTVKNHLTWIMTKLRASDRTHAVVTAVRLGWLAI
ncbi:MAG: response regulator transcription factor [Chloroflexi bacterium]|nr:response regulator transcription factor [Chloroflexota bacterium]